MRIWDLEIDKPLQFTLAADSRFCKIDQFNDQIWEFIFAAKDPPALTLHTTYGLRAQSMRLFPQFTLDDKTFVNPLDFQQKPRLQYFLSNYFSLLFSPCEGVEILGEYWIPDSHTVTGRYTIQNLANRVITLRFDLSANIKPLDEGENFSPGIMGANTILSASTHDLKIVCGLDGSAQSNPNPYSSISQDIQIVPGKSRTTQWAIVSTTDIEQSFAKLKHILSRSWEAEIARILMVNESQAVEVYTGDPEWDLVLAASQKAAYSLVMGGSGSIPAFVTSRGIDMGYSFAEDGKGLIPQWKKQTPLDAYYLAGFLLPGSHQLVRQILEGFLFRQTDPSLIKDQLAQPLLCTLALMYVQASGNWEWIKENLTILHHLLLGWFTPEYDRDQDFFPEWQDVFQSGLEDSPTFDRWKPETQGLNIRLVESPSLAAFLYKECASLQKIALEVEDHPISDWAQDRMNELRKLLEDCWNEKLSCYLYRDFQTHISQKGKLIHQSVGSAHTVINKSFSKAQRLLLHITGKDDTRRKFKITFHGRKQKDEVVEVVDYFNLSWLQGRSYYTSNFLYTRLDKIEIEGLNEEDCVEVFCADHQLLDISLLLPLWAGSAGSSRAAKLIEKTIHKTFWGNYGLPVAPQSKNELFLAKPPKVSGIWNHLIGQGLLVYNKQEMACTLVKNWMLAKVKTFNKQFSFQESHHYQTAEPSGEMDQLRGFPPLSLFLEVLGVKYIHKDRVALFGNNPFPWPVTVKYKGTSITRHKSDTVITFSSGHTITVTGSEPQEIRLLQEKIIE